MNKAKFSGIADYMNTDEFDDFIGTAVLGNPDHEKLRDKLDGMLEELCGGKYLEVESIVSEIEAYILDKAFIEGFNAGLRMAMSAFSGGKTA